MVVGITLGVAVAVAIDLANVSAGRAFDLGTDAVVGRATHQIVGGPQGLDEAVYVRLRRQGITLSAPVVTEYVSSPQLGGHPLQLLGVDPFAEAPFRDYLPGTAGSAAGDLTAFLTRPGAVLISADAAAQYGLALGSPVAFDVAGRERQAFLAGLLQPADSRSRRALDGIVLADIATAQELSGRLGKLDRIDLILPTGDDAALKRVEALLPQDVRVLSVEARTGAIKEMTNAFRLNLTALSLLALVVGMFLIYNTMTFSVLQRRSLFGTMRCLGVTRREVFALVASEALIVGLLGAGLGVGLGVVMGQGAVQAVTRTINDLYFVVTVRSVEVPLVSLIKGACLGVAATLATAAFPAWEAASVPPRVALSRSGLETKARRATIWAAVGGVLVLAVGAVLLGLPSASLIVSFVGTFAVIVGFAMMTPVATTLLMYGATPLLGRLWGTLGRMAPRDVVSSLSRTAVAVAALMVALSVTIGVSLMVGSFRHTVITWLADVLRGDVYISAPAPSSAQPPTIEPAVIEAVQRWPGVEKVGRLRAATVDSPYGLVHVAAVDNAYYAREHTYVATDRPPADVWEAMQAGSVVVSEPFANRLKLPQHGGSITLETDDGARVFPVVGIYYDYASSEGIVSMALQTYRQFWHDRDVTALSLRLAPGTDPDAFARDLQDAIAPMQRLLVRPNRALRNDVLVIFDRTFAITNALQLLATVVAFIGVLSALLALQLEKQREMSVLRAMGLTVGQLWHLVMLETGLMGAVAGLLSMPTGFALSLILVYIINRRSFGWTLQMQVGATPFVQSMLVAVTAALLAGIYPLRKTTKTVTAEGLRFE